MPPPASRGGSAAACLDLDKPGASSEEQVKPPARDTGWLRTGRSFPDVGGVGTVKGPENLVGAEVKAARPAPSSPPPSQPEASSHPAVLSVGSGKHEAVLPGCFKPSLE